MYKIILYLLLLFSFSFSQIITYEDALNLTMKNNKKLKSSKLDLESSKLEIEKVKALSYGQLNLSHEMSRTNHPGYVFNSKLSSREASFNDFGADKFGTIADLNVIPENLNNPDARNNYNTKVTYDIPLFTGFKLQNQEEVLKVMHKAQNLKVNLDMKSLQLEVLKAYNSAVVAKEFLKASKKAKEAVSLFVNSANEFYKEGLVTKIDTKQARVQELNVQSKVIEASNNFDLALAYLRFLTSNEKIKDVKLLKQFTILKTQINDLHKSALDYRDDLKILESSKDGMKKNIDLNKASYYPNIYSHLEYGFNDDSITFDSQKDYYLGMIGIKYTLFDNSRDKDLQKSKIEFNKAILNLNQLKDGIKLEVQKAKLNLNAKNEIFKEKEEAKDLAFEILEQSKLMYKNQLTSMTDLLKQEASYRENEASLIMAKYEKSLAQAILKLAIGQDLK